MDLSYLLGSLVPCVVCSLGSAIAASDTAAPNIIYTSLWWPFNSALPPGAQCARDFRTSSHLPPDLGTHIIYVGQLGSLCGLQSWLGHRCKRHCRAEPNQPSNN